jgi:hypothetical protein
MATYGSSVNQFFWYLRAFFWELVAAFDTALHVVNADLKLDVPEEDVTWDSIRSAAERTAKRSPALEAVAAAWASTWYSEVRAYRNFSHRAFPFLQIECRPEGAVSIIFLLPARECQDNSFAGYDVQLSRYLEEMIGMIRVTTVKPSEE